MSPQGVEVLAEDPVGAEQGLQVFEREQQHSEHTVRAVDQGETFFCGEPEGSDASAFHDIVGLDRFSSFQQLTLPNEAEADVGEGGEISARAHRAVLGDGGGEVSVEERHQGVDEFGADSGVARGKGLRPDHHHGPHDLRLDELSHTGGVAAEERVLELEAVYCGDPGVRERPETCGHPVDWTGAFDHDLDAPAGCAHALSSLLAHRNSRPLPGDSDDGGRVEVLYVENYGSHRTATSSGSVCSQDS